MDFYNPDDIQKFFEMDKEERQEATQEWLATIAEPWQGDSAEDQMARSMISALNAYLQVAYNVQDFSKVNRHMMGLWMHGYLQMAKNFQTLAAITQIRKNYEK